MGFFHWMKKEGRKIGHKIKHASKRVKKYVHHIKKKVKHDVKKAGHWAKKEAKKAEKFAKKEGKKVAKEAGKAGKYIETHAVRDVESLVDFGEEVAKELGGDAKGILGFLKNPWVIGGIAVGGVYLLTRKPNGQQQMMPMMGPQMMNPQMMPMMGGESLIAEAPEAAMLV